MVANIVSPRVDTDWAVSPANFPTNDSMLLNVCYYLLTVLGSFHIPAPANHLNILIFINLVCLGLHVSMYVCVYVCVCMCVHVCVCTCVCVWVLVYLWVCGIWRTLLIHR